MKTKIGTEVAHVTRDSNTTFKVKRSRSPGRLAHRRVGASGGCSGGRENVLVVGNCCYVAVCSAARGASAPTGGRGEGRVHIVAAARLQLVYINSVRGANRLWGETSMGRNAHGARRLWGEISFHRAKYPGAKCP